MIELVSANAVVSWPVKLPALSKGRRSKSQRRADN
jgi:hypothetical protein